MPTGVQRVWIIPAALIGLFACLMSGCRRDNQNHELKVTNEHPVCLGQCANLEDETRCRWDRTPISKVVASDSAGFLPNVTIPGSFDRGDGRRRVSFALCEDVIVAIANHATRPIPPNPLNPDRSYSVFQCDGPGVGAGETTAESDLWSLGGKPARIRCRPRNLEITYLNQVLSQQLKKETPRFRAQPLYMNPAQNTGGDIPYCFQPFPKRKVSISCNGRTKVFSNFGDCGEDGRPMIRWMKRIAGEASETHPEDSDYNGMICGGAMVWAASSFFGGLPGIIGGLGGVVASIPSCAHAIFGSGERNVWRPVPGDPGSREAPELSGDQTDARALKIDFQDLQVKLARYFIDAKNSVDINFDVYTLYRQQEFRWQFHKKVALKIDGELVAGEISKEPLLSDKGATFRVAEAIPQEGDFVVTFPKNVDINEYLSVLPVKTDFQGFHRAGDGIVRVRFANKRICPGDDT